MGAKPTAKIDVKGLDYSFFFPILWYFSHLCFALPFPCEPI
jgi:hypothetical protein